MSVLNQSGEEQVECPLCMEPLEVDDLNFFPCTCGYQICRFCWHRIRTDENGLCPACRKAYPENPADFKPLSQEEVAKLKAEKRHKDQQRKQKITENRKHLANVRVVQRNLVFVVGLPMRLADSEVLKKHEYFGKFGKIHKVVINQSTSYAGSQGPSASAYVTYQKADDALRAIQAVNNILVDGRTVKTSLGTTKYCSHFMKNQTCPKPDCMYLHDLGDIEASFTKEEMQQGKHQEYERKLHEQLLNSYNQASKDRKPTSSPPSVTLNSVNCHAINSSSCSGAHSNTNSMQTNHSCSKEAWPSLQPGMPSSGSSSTSSISSNSSASSNSNGNCGHANNSSIGSTNGSGGSISHHGNMKENSRRQKFEHGSKTTGPNHKKRHGAEDHRGKTKDKVHNSANEDYANKTVHNKTNHSNNARVNTKAVKEVAHDQKVSVVTRSQSQATTSSDNVSADNQSERVVTRVDSETRDGENDVNITSGTVSNDSSARGGAAGGRALTTSHRAATLFEPDNNSFFSSNSFTKVSTSAAGSGPEWPLSSLTLTHMPDVLPPVHSSEDWQAAFGFSNSSTTGPVNQVQIQSDSPNPSQVVSENPPATGKEFSGSKDSESCDSVNFESQNDQQISVQGFNCNSSHSSTENITSNVVTSTEDFQLSDVGQLNQKLNEFTMEEGNGTVSSSAGNGVSGPLPVSETNTETITMHSTASCENQSAVQCSQSPLYSTLPSPTFVQDPTIFMVNRHPFLPSGTHMIPNGIQPIQAAKFLSEFNLRQGQVQTSQPLPMQVHGHTVLESTNYSRHLIEGTFNGKFGVINMNAFGGGSGDGTNILTLSKSVREISKLQNGADETIAGSGDANHILENGKFTNYEIVERPKNGENCSDEYIEYSESENCVQEHNEDLSIKDNRVTDDDLGFDPFHETQKALAEMMEKENMMLMLQGQQNHVPHPNQHINHLNQLHQQYQHVNHLNHHPTHFGQAAVFGGNKVLPGYNTPLASHHLLSQQIATNNHRLQVNAANVGSCTKLVDGLALGSTNVPPRARLPPPGFTTAPNHMNAFGLGIPRAPSNTGSKILPFMGLGNSSSSSNNGNSSPISQSLNTLPNTLPNNISLTSNLNSQSNITPPILFPHTNNPSNTLNQINSIYGSQNGTITHTALSKSCSENFNTKEWSDNLRSLLPNLPGGNGVSQSPVPAAFSGSNTPTPPPPPPLPPPTQSNQNSTFTTSNHVAVQSTTLKTWSGTGPCSDWTALDPAIMSSRPHNFLNSNSPPQHPIILCNTNSVLNQANPNTQYLHLPNTTHWLRSLASDGCLLYGTNMSQNISSSDWNVQTHATVNSIAPPPPGFSLRMTSQQTTVQSKLAVSSSQEMAKIENI